MGSEQMTSGDAYRQWLVELKGRFRLVQLKAAVAVNTALLQFYWDLGADIAARQQKATWGSGFLAQLSADLMREFPDMNGFSKRNLELIRQWHLYWQQASPPIAKQAVSQNMSEASRGQLPSIEQIKRALGLEGGGDPPEAVGAGV